MTDAPDPKTNDAKPDEAAKRGIDEIVQHTDSGSGTSQREHWPANVDQPNLDGEPS
jgi:hypothetical protein